MANAWHSLSAPHRRLHTGDRGEDVQRFQKGLESRTGIAVPNNGVVGAKTLEVKRKAFWDLGLPSRDHPITTAAQANVRWPWTRRPAARRRARERATGVGSDINPARDGAKATVEKLVAIAQSVKADLYVVSDFRPGDPMDHGANGFDKAARDIAYPGIDALKGPPSSWLDSAVVAIGRAVGRGFKPGVPVIDTWHVDGWRLQVIWRTTKYGGHMGHIHCGCHRD